jgi:hypothetical protein
MRDEMPEDAYRDAYNEASSELQKIFGEVERLRIRRERVAKLVEVLNNRFGFRAHLADDPLTWRSQYEGLTVATRIEIVPTTPEFED